MLRENFSFCSVDAVIFAVCVDDSQNVFHVNAFQIVSVLESHYSKLKQLNGAWLCYKAAGNTTRVICEYVH